MNQQSRAIAYKFIYCEHGMISLRSFFHTPYIYENGSISSSQQVQTLLKELIATENKEQPYSDAQLCQLFTEKGIPCARRTIAKHRSELQIPKASLRKRN